MIVNEAGHHHAAWMAEPPTEITEKTRPFRPMVSGVPVVASRPAEHIVNSNQSHG